MKDLQAMLEVLAPAFEKDEYESPVIEQITQAVIHNLKNEQPKNVRDSKRALHSLIKSYKNLRYGSSEIFTVITDKVIELVLQGQSDEALTFFTLNRLAISNEVGNFERMNTLIREKGLHRLIIEP